MFTIAQLLSSGRDRQNGDKPKSKAGVWLVNVQIKAWTYLKSFGRRTPREAEITWGARCLALGIMLSPYVPKSAERAVGNWLLIKRADILLMWVVIAAGACGLIYFAYRGRQIEIASQASSRDWRLLGRVVIETLVCVGVPAAILWSIPMNSTSRAAGISSYAINIVFIVGGWSFIAGIAKIIMLLRTPPKPTR